MKKLLFVLSLVLFPVSAFASQCDQFFPNGKEIVVPGTKVICHSFYASVYDAAHEANVFSTELTQPKDSKTARVDAFRPDPAVANSPTPDDYTSTGFDRGHMVPAADSSNPTQMSETFFMTNMTPQYPNVNRVAWRLLEVAVRDMDSKNVLTGAVYKDYNTTIGKHKVPVPVALYKVVYLKDGSIKAFEADNIKENKSTKPIAIEDLEKQVGFKLH
jgi:endonuclease G, mitochondrial